MTMGMMHARGGATALPPLALLSQALPRLTRHEPESVVELLIDRLDTVDGDPDIEANGDELDGTAGEDDFYPHSGRRNHPGCTIGDPDAACDDFAIDAAEEGSLEVDEAEGQPNPLYDIDQRQMIHRLNFTKPAACLPALPAQKSRKNADPTTHRTGHSITRIASAAHS